MFLKPRSKPPLTTFAFILFLLLASTSFAANRHCSDTGVQLQILGSGGPEVGDQRASSSYLIWLNGKARVLIDVGGGSSVNFGRSGAKMENLDVILFSHFHADHSADLPALVKSSFFDDRQHDLPLFGPSASYWMPDTEEFLESLFGIKGAFRYLSAFLDDGRSNGFRLLATSLDVGKKQIQAVFKNKRMSISAIPVHHGPLPALAWRVEVAGKSLIFSGDMNGDYRTLELLAKDADILLAHNAVPESAHGVERNLHMPPSVIGKIAGQARAKQLLLSHRMKRTLRKETETLENIRQHYHGPVAFVDDLQCFTP